MFRFGLIPLVSSALQLTVPSYGLRLVRRFGTQKIGWFLVVAFAALGLVHLVQPVSSVTPGTVWGANPHLLYAVASVLLLIGMGHLEGLFSERLNAYRQGLNLKGQWDKDVEATHRANAELTARIARMEQGAKVLQGSEQLYRALFADNPLPMWILDLRKLRFLSVNRAALQQHEYTLDEFLSLRPEDLLAAEAAESFLRDASRPCSGPQQRGCWRHRRKDQTVLDLELTATDLKFGDSPARLIIGQDVSQRRRQHAAALQAQRLETIGLVAAGASHHFNNIMTIIDGHANLLLRNPPDAQAAEQLRQISTAANRAAALTRQLVAAGARQKIEPAPLGLNTLLREMTPMLRRLVGERIVIQQSLFSNLPAINADARALQQITINLVLNARDAMNGAGTLNIATAIIRIRDGERDFQARTGDFVCLSIHDGGCGMTPEVQSHVFEPFFTTHDVGRATGLGLASVFGLVKQHLGWIEFSTRPATGTEFRIYFPALPAGVVPQQQEATQVATRETVLLIEADERACGLARYILQRQGYRVIEADCASTALLLWESNASQADLLVTPLAFADGLSGAALANRLRKAKPTLKVIYTSDCDPSAEGQDQAQAALQGFQLLIKPFNPERLLQAVETCLARQS